MDSWQCLTSDTGSHNCIHKGTVNPNFSLKRALTIDTVTLNEEKWSMDHPKHYFPDHPQIDRYAFNLNVQFERKVAVTNSGV